MSSQVHAALVPLLIGLTSGATPRAEVPGASTVGACTINWTGSAGDQQWTTATNWNPIRVPNSTDVACIPSSYHGPAVTISSGTNSVSGVNAQGTAGFELQGGFLQLKTDSAISDLSLDGGQITVALGAVLTLSGTPFWTNGTLAGAGTTDLPSGTTMFWDGGELATALTNEGTVNWVSGSPCFAGAAAVFTNNASFVISAEGVSLYACSGSPKFVNAAGGFIAEQGTTGAYADISLPLNNLGSVTLTSGDLYLDGGNSSGSTDTGSYEIDSGNYLVLDGGTRTLASTATLTGAGTVIISNSQIVVFNGQTIPNLSLSGGTTRGAFTLTGNSVFSGGTITDPSGTVTTTTVASGATLTIEGSPTLTGHNLTNSTGGIVNWPSSNSALYLGIGAIFTNSGTLNLNASGLNIYYTGVGALPSIVNAAGGSIVRNGTPGTTLYVEIPFNNLGKVTVTSGGLELDAGNSTGSTDTGSYAIGSGSSLTLGGGTRTFASGATLTGSGTLSIAADAQTVVFNGQSIPNLSLSSGTTRGPFTLTGKSVFSGGTISDPSGTVTATTVASGATLTIEGSSTFTGHNLTNNLGGIVNLPSSNSTLYLGGGAVFTNSGTLNLNATGQDIYYSGIGAQPSIVNAAGGSMVRNGTPGTTFSIQIPFNNLGKVSVNSGHLELDSGNSTGSTDTGSFAIGSGSNLILAGGTRTFASTAKITGSGTLSIPNAGQTVIFTGQSIPNLNLSGGTTRGPFTLTGKGVFSSGLITDPGGVAATSTTVGSGATLTLNGTAEIAHHNLVNGGTLKWTANGGSLGGNAVLTNNGLFSITAVGGYFSNADATTPRIVNGAAGTMLVNVAGTVAEGFPTTNNGVLNVQLGVFNMYSSYSQGATGSFNTTIDGTTPGHKFGQLSVSTTTHLGGSLGIKTPADFTPALGDTFALITSAGTETGSFSSVTGQSVTGGNAYQPLYSASGTTLKVEQAADLALAGSAPSNVVHGDQISYSLTISNDGPNTATSVVLTDPLPSGVTFVSAQPGCALSGTKVLCAEGNLASGSNVVITITVQTSTAGTVQNTETVTAGTVDVTPGDNKATQVTTVS